MRKTLRKRDTFRISKEIIYLSIIFIIFVAIGTYLNKIFSNGQNIVLDSINNLNDYYSHGSDINISAVVFSNLRENIIFLGSIVLFSLFVFTFPLAIISFLLKGISIGYTINSLILLIKLKSIKMILIMVIKNFIIIPGAILIIAVSFYYIKNIYEEYKRGRKEGVLFLGRRYLLNGIIIIVICASAQLLLNAVSVGILQFLVR
ncbi:stage II sporulation protein M [Terrisporobacter petrolearius]|uniref:stage II sporulation protein M n=1 Tax=Terrisporobacter petrolearius TaxID=1460447 RepID=UPI0031CCD636